MTKPKPKKHHGDNDEEYESPMPPTGNISQLHTTATRKKIAQRIIGFRPESERLKPK